MPKARVNPVGEKTFLWTGCAGDVAAGMAVMRQLGGGHLRIGNHHMCGDGYHKPICGPRYQSLAPLLAAQPYVKSVSYNESRKVDYDSSDWRTHYKSWRSLAECQGDYFGIEKLDLSPWIKVDPSEETKGRVIMARSLRYWNHAFPWHRAVREYKDKALFVGLKEEHEVFQQVVKAKVEFRPTENLLELAQLIAGSSLMMANQSCPIWLAMAMGHTLIQETASKNPDSKIVRDNAIFVTNGNVRFPKL